MATPPPIRPTFNMDLPLTVEQTVAALREAFEAAGEHPLQNEGRHIVVTVPPSVRHFWSPYLTLEAQDSAAGVRLHGRFSPKPAIWTGFMLGYIALITAGAFGLMFGVSFQISGSSGLTAYAIGTACLLAALGMYLASLAGQRLAREQMGELGEVVRRAVGDAEGGTRRHEPA